MILAVPIAWMGLPAAAQSSDADTLTDRTHRLEGVTVTETRKERVTRSATPFHLLEREQFQRLGVTDVADALHNIPGITLRDYGGAGGMKTVSVRGYGARHTGISYDGVMLSDCQSGEIDISRYSLDNVSELALNIGDNDDIFIPARQATNPAVLSIQTLRLPSADTKGHLTAQMKLGSFGLVSPYVRYEQSVTPKLAFSVEGEHTYAKNDYPFTLHNYTLVTRETRTHSRMKQGHAEMNMAWQPTGQILVGGKVYYYDNDRQLPGMVRLYTNLSGENLRERNAFVQAFVRMQLTSKFLLKAIAKYNWAESVYTDDLYAGGVNDASYWQREAYTSAALLYVANEKWSFDYSGDYSFNNLNGSSWRTLVGKPYRLTVLQSATARYRIPRLTVLGRLLYSLYLNESKRGESARNMRRLSPSLSLSYKLVPDEELYVRASYKNIFRSPTFNESYYYHYGSTDLAPEVTDQFNVGLTWGIFTKDEIRRTKDEGRETMTMTMTMTEDEGRRVMDDGRESTMTMTGDEGRRTMGEGTQVRVTLDAYYNRLRDMIVSVPYNMFVWSCVNVGKVRILGVDGTLNLSHHLNAKHLVILTGNFSYQRAQNRTNPHSPNYNKQIAYMPEYSWAAAVSYENPWVNLSVHGHGISSRWPNNDHYAGTLIRGYQEFGVTAYRAFSWGRHRMEGRVDVKNLLDEQYELVGHYPMPGRSWQISILYKI